MRTILVFIVLTLTSLTSFADDQCNWGSNPPKKYRCNGQTYIKGTAACRSGIYSGVFCHEALIKDGKACSEDVDAETMKCHQKLFNVQDDEVATADAAKKTKKPMPISPGWPKSEKQTQATDKKAKEPLPASSGSQPEKQADPAPQATSAKSWGTLEANEDQCSWKEPGAEDHVCEGETFVYGNLACARRGMITHLFCMKTHEGNVDDCINDNDPKTLRCLKSLTGLRPKAVANPATTAPSGTIQ